MFSVLGAAAIAAMSVNQPPPAEARVTSAPSSSELEAAAYGESGTEYFGSNEVPDVYREHALGVGLLDTVRFGPNAGNAFPTGTLLLIGVTSELRALETTHCGLACAAPSDHFKSGLYAGLRAGAGYDWSGAGFRAGLLMMGGNAVGANALVFPDLALRLGPLDVGYVSLGLGEYDAPTTVRPGLYAGATLVLAERLTLSVHYGAHFDHGTLGDTVVQADPRLDLTLGYRASNAVSLTAGGVKQISGTGYDVYEAHFSLRVRLPD